MKEVILMGKGSLAIKIAKWFNQNSDYKLKLIVPVIPEPSWTDSLISWSKQNNIEYIKSGNYLEIPEINNENVNNLIKQCKQGPHSSNVIHVKIQDYKQEYSKKSFDILSSN